MQVPDNSSFESSLISSGEILDRLPLGVILFNEAFEIVFYNQNIFYFGVKRFAADDYSASNPLLLSKLIPGFPSTAEIEKLRNGEAVEKELANQRTTDGAEISIILKSVSLFDDDTFKGGLLLLEDLKIPAAMVQKKHEYLDEYFEAILDSVWSLFLLITPDGKIQLAGGSKIKSFTVPNVTPDTKIYDFFRSDIQDKIIPTFRSSLTKKKQEELIFDIGEGNDDDKDEYYECQITPFVGENGRITFAFISIREITTFLKMIERYKRENSELHNIQKFNQNISVAIFAIAASGKIIFWNKATESLLHLRRSEVFGKHISRILPHFSDTELGTINKSLTEQKTITLEGDYQVLNNEALKLRFKLQKISDGGDSVFIFEGSDIEKEVRDREALTTELRFYSLFYDMIDLPAIRISKAGLITASNSVFDKEFAYAREGDHALYFMDMIPQEYIVKHDITFQSIATHLEKLNIIPFRIGEGKINKYEVNFLVPKSANEETIGCILRNVNDELKFEKEYTKFKSVFELSSDGLALTEDNNFSLVNLSFAALLAYETCDELTGHSILSIVAEEDRQRMADNFASLSGGVQNALKFDFIAMRKDGAKLSLSTTITPLEFDKRLYHLIAARDITELKRVQQAIKESEERYRSITENIEDFFWSAERIQNKMKSTFYSSSVQKISGYTQEDFLADSKFFFKLIYPDDFKAVKERLKRFYSNIYKRSDEIEFRIVNKNGNIVWVRNKVSVIRDRKGTALKIFGLVSDISVQKKAEDNLRSTTDNLQKLNETKDKFISIISHDLRTPFSSIMGFTDLLLTEDDLTPEESKQYVRYIQESSKTMLSLVNSLLDWTRIQTGRIPFEPVPVHFNQFVQKVLSGMTGYAMQKKITLINNVPDEISLMVDQSLVMQAMNNLLSNALKFTPEDGEISVSCSQSEQARFIQVAVHDTGKGIKPEDIAKIFSIEAKFTTEGTAGEKGTGLGLTLVKEIIEKHRGKIWVESEFGKGSTFYFTLPKASALILLIDDSSTDRILYAKLLKNIVGDYDVVTATNGKEGLAQLQKHIPALIVCDHAMPVMNGFEFVQAYNNLQLKGKPPVIILSGDVGKSEQITYGEMGVEYVFPKPVNLTSFKNAIDKLLKQIPH